MTRGTAETSRRRPGEQRRRGSTRADAQDYPERKRVSRHRHRRRRPAGLRVAAGPRVAGGLRVAAGALAAGLLFLGYLRVSWTTAATSDGAAQALQARDMLAGNWLLHGWTVSDVSFYTTELPEYVLVELVRPLGAGVIHVAAAVTYTLLVLGAVVLARGRARGFAGLIGGLVAAGIMLAPQLGYGAFVLLLSPDHVGTQVPLLLGWLLLDLTRSSPGGATPRRPAVIQRWRVPAALCFLLAWVQFADRVAVVTAVLPLVVVCGGRVIRRLRDRAGTDSGSLDPSGYSQRSAISSSGDCRFEVALCVAGVGSVGVAWAGARVLAAAGGFAAHPLPFTLAPLRLLWTHSWLTGWGILELYGANFLGVTGWAGLASAVLHLAALALAVAAVGVALGRFSRPRGIHAPLLARPAPAGETIAAPATAARRRQAGQRPAADLVDSVLAVAIVANLASYALSVEPGTVLGTGYDAREIAAVLPLGAVLAGRVFGPRLAASLERARSVRRPPFMALAFGLLLTGYAVAFGWSAAQPRAVSGDQVLANWLVGHGLRYGLGGPSANLVTVDSGGRTGVAVVTVRKGRVRPLLYQSPAAAYDPWRHDATFLIAGAPAARAGDAAEAIPAAAVRATFGRPARVYRFDGFTVDVWNVNLLTKTRG